MATARTSAQCQKNSRQGFAILLFLLLPFIIFPLASPVLVPTLDFDTARDPAYIWSMEKPKSSIFDIGVYLFLVLVIVGLFGFLWRATDFFTAVAALQFFGPIVFLLSIGPSMLFGKMFAAVAKWWEEWFKSKKPPHSSAPGHPVHTPI